LHCPPSPGTGHCLRPTHGSIMSTAQDPTAPTPSPPGHLLATSPAHIPPSHTPLTHTPAPPPPCPAPQYFTVSMQDACKALELGLTVLKRVCRHYGISRWPYRKFASLDRLIVDMKEAGRQNPGQAYVAWVEELQEKRWAGPPCDPCTGALSGGGAGSMVMLCCVVGLATPCCEGSMACVQPYASGGTAAAASTAASPRQASLAGSTSDHPADPPPLCAPAPAPSAGSSSTTTPTWT
jgi:hypothetical protein